MESDDRCSDERGKAEQALRLALAADARRERDRRAKIKTWFYIGTALLFVLFVAAMLFT